MGKGHTPKHALKVTEPKKVHKKSISVDFKDLFKALTKGVTHVATLKWDEIANDAIEALASLGLATDNEELAFLLVRRSVVRATIELIRESASYQLGEARKNSEELIEHLDFAISIGDMTLDNKFLERPSDLPLLKDIKNLLRDWMELIGVSKATATAISDRFPTYFVFALNQEWRSNFKSYRTLAEAIDTPFTKAGDREWAWAEYSALLQRRVNESIFEEPFGLSQIYVPLNAFYTEDVSGKTGAGDLVRASQKRRRVVVSLKDELESWLQNTNAQEAIRVISGGPGSGKSSFARIFAAELSRGSKHRVLFVPLHLIDPNKDLIDEIDRFIKDEGILAQNPLDRESPEPNLLLIFDGLDELASQGKAAAETARGFVREVEKTVERRNANGVKLRVLISGRELVVQESEAEFRRPRQVLSVLPYSLHPSARQEDRIDRDAEEYFDPENRLRKDLRQQWWQKYGELTGSDFTGLPEVLDRDDLAEITAQPLLNYLVALSYARGTIDFTKDVNLNSVYSDLVAAVYERGYEKHRRYAPIRHMKLDDFCRVLEEIGLASWHGDGRTTTVREIEEHCRNGGVGPLLDTFQEGAKAGVTRLLAAFFFRQYGHRPTGDPTFVFTHKSFGEYLTSRRLVRAIERLNRELETRQKDLDGGWDEREALRHWAQVCGPSALSKYLHTFLLYEIKLRDYSDVVKWQHQLAKLFSFMLRHGLPMELINLAPYRESAFQARNAEEALLVALNVCATLTKHLSAIEHPAPTAFGAWLKRIQGQRRGPESAVALKCLSYLDLRGIYLDIGDFYGADFSFSDLRGAYGRYTCFAHASLRGANLELAFLSRANLEYVELDEATLTGCVLMECDLRGTTTKTIEAVLDMRDADFRNCRIDPRLKPLLTKRSAKV